MVSECIPPNPPSFVADNGAYVTPDENVVNEFMQDISEERILASYEVADEQTVAGLMSSLKRKQTLNGLTAGKLTYLYHDKGNKKVNIWCCVHQP